MIGKLIDYMVLYWVLKSPILYMTLIAGFIFFIVFCGIFIRFKNGVISYLLYFILVGITGYGAYQYVMPDTPPGPNPDEPSKTYVTVVDVRPKGIAIKRRIGRSFAIPLYGVTMPKDKVGLNNIKVCLESQSPTMEFELQLASKSYGGVLYTKDGVDVNKLLLERGLAYSNVDTPVSYGIRRGLWSGLWGSQWFCVVVLGVLSNICLYTFNEKLGKQVK